MIFAGEGKDIITLRGIGDAVIGDGGNDSFFSNLVARSTIEGGNGVDTLTYSNSIDLFSVAVGTTGIPTALTLFAETDAITGIEYLSFANDTSVGKETNALDLGGVNSWDMIELHEDPLGIRTAMIVPRDNGSIAQSTYQTVSLSAAQSPPPDDSFGWPSIQGTFEFGLYLKQRDIVQDNGQVARIHYSQGARTQILRSPPRPGRMGHD